MKSAWNAHRFSGGVLVLDLVNTVVHRQKPAMRFDRLTDCKAASGFAVAAAHFRQDELDSSHLLPPGNPATLRNLLQLREASDALFRPGELQTKSQSFAPHQLQALFKAAAKACSQQASKDRSATTLNMACALSSIRLIGSGTHHRIRTCPSCDWLFVDRSKNGSRRWCDMAVCGNRAKAAAHYQHTRPNK